VAHPQFLVHSPNLATQIRAKTRPDRIFGPEDLNNSMC